MFLRKGLAVSALSLLISVSALAADRLPAKQLAGPIDDMRTGHLADVDPISSALHAKSAMIPVEMFQTKSGDWIWRGRMAVETSDFRMLIFSGNETWDVSLTSPYSKKTINATERAVEISQEQLAMGDESYTADVYVFENMEPGTWNISISSPTPLNGSGYLVYGSRSPYRLLSYKNDHGRLVGDQVSIVSYGFDKNDDQLNNIGLVERAWMRITTPDGDVRDQPMFDDGLHNDGKAGDGIFGGVFNAELIGEYQTQVIAHGTTPEGNPFIRTAEHLVPVIAPEVMVKGNTAVTRVADDKRLDVSVMIDQFEGSADKYRVFAEVWGSADGEMRASNWIGGMVYADNGRLDLSLDTRWLAMAGVEAPYQLRNVRIQDADSFINLAVVDTMNLSIPKLPTLGRILPKTIDQEMLTGPRPARKAAKAGPKLLLVHGYCSGNAWGGQQGQFANSVVFQDFNQNRSHDQFAVLVGNFGASYSSFGIVAHSQGGAAATHLYTYYWSGLDYATGNRLIQSVGTPYQGTSLAGNLALLGSIFGIGCGTNTDLTYSGASAWLSGIPSWARSRVTYFTTSFKDRWWAYDYCQIASDVVLDDPDDGTTEKWSGQLSGANNGGHKTGWCHTSGMRDPAQTTDSSRNSSMSANAAR